jgi:predicted ribosome-associated RNA-binding protein Tma20
MSKKNKLTPEQEKELIKIAAEIEAEAISMKMDYDKNPSHESGSVVYVNEQSTLLEDEDERLGDKALVSSSQILAKELKKQKKKGDKK